MEAKEDALTRKFDLLMVETGSSNLKAVKLCETCGGGHNVSYCPILGTSIAPMDQVDFVSGGLRPQDNLITVPSEHPLLPWSK